VPIINAGDGAGQHPTQALLDLYTIQKEMGKIDGIKIAMVGDLFHGRTVRSLSYLLSKYSGIEIYFVSPDVVRMRDDIKEHLNENNIKWHENDDLLDVAKKVDVIYQTRIQRERFGERQADYNEAKGKYVIDKELMKKVRDNAIIMHPLPRVDEIHSDVDTDKRAAYFRQAENGLYVRMALLKAVLYDKKNQK
jgi:aspartate carbamoyltransferase catalytic subunit